MTTTIDTPPGVNVKSTLALAIGSGLLITIIGSVPFSFISPLNATFHPEIPWAAILTAIYVLAILFWLNGGGWPRSSALSRRFYLRLWRPEVGAFSSARWLEIAGLVLAIVGLYTLWIVRSPNLVITDFSAYPTTAYRVSLFVMGALVSGVVEEAAFRGYMQSQLERIGPAFAVLVTSVVFALAHATHGLAALLVMAPGYFLISLCFGQLALRCGSILPGMFLHVMGDGTRAFFVFLGGDASLLIAN